MSFGFSQCFIGFLFMLIPSKRDLLLVECLEWLKPLSFSLFQFSRGKAGAPLLQHDCICLRRQLR